MIGNHQNCILLQWT